MPITHRIAALTALIVVASLSAGPLNPPVGAITATAKPLAEIEPRTAINAANTPGDADSLYRITQPGSYYLTGNLTGVTGKHGIEISSINGSVTIDLNGFELLGAPSSPVSDGIINVWNSAVNITILNGSIRAWGRNGINLSSLPVAGGRIEGVNASGNGAAGITCPVGGVVKACTASDNTGSGFIGLSGSTLTGCAAYANSGGGFTLNTSCVITDCSSYNNDGIGILSGAGGLVSNCSVRQNSTDGITCAGGCTVKGNACIANGFGSDGAGIHATGADNRIEGNNVTTSDRGIDVAAAGNFITRNTCTGNTVNWNVAAGNVILVVNAATNAAAVTGNTGGVAPGSTDPNANFTY